MLGNGHSYVHAKKIAIVGPPYNSYWTAYGQKGIANEATKEKKRTKFNTYHGRSYIQFTFGPRAGGVRMYMSP